MLSTELRKPIGNISETPLEHGDKDAHTLVSALGAERDAVKKRIDDERAKAESKLSTRLSRSSPRRAPATAKSSAPAPAPVGVTPEHLQVQGAGANLCNGAYDLIANISGKSAFATTTTDNRQIKLFWMPPAKAWSISGAGKYLPFYGLIRTSNCSSFGM